MADDFSNDTNTKGVVAVNGPSVTGVIEVAGDYDLFKVSLQAGKTYSITLVRSADNGLSDPYLELYGPDTFFIEEADDGLRGGNARIEYTADVSGIYYIGASDPYVQGAGRYEVAVRLVDFAADDFTDTIATKGRVVVNGSPVTGNIQFNNDYDLFKVDLVKGQFYTFVLAAGSGGLVDPYLDLYDPSADYIRSDDESQGNHNARIEYVADVTGTYFLGARDYSTGVGTYQLVASSLDLTRDDFSDAADTTGVVTAFGPAVRGAMNFDYDYDVFKVQLIAGQSYAIEVTGVLGGTADPYVELFGPDLLFITKETGNGIDASGFELPLSYIDFTAMASGIHYIGVFDYSNSVGGYQVRVGSVPGITTNGTAFDNDIFGGLGADQLIGFGGDDIVVGYNGDDTIDGGDGNDSLEGDGGNDLIKGGTGNDTVYYAGPQSDYIVTRTGATSYTVQDKLTIDGIDTLIDVENLSFSTGTVSGLGQDVAKYLSSVKGQVTKFVPGTDISGVVTYEAISWTNATAGVQIDLLKGVASANGSTNKIKAIDGMIGSKFGDQLVGDGEDNLIDGGAGADQMEGGRGNDVYVVNDAGDVIIETENPSPASNETELDPLDVGGSIDKVIASISYTLGRGLEDLDLAAGAGNINGTGNLAPNTISGNEGKNSLTGGGGDDILYGGAGIDTAVFSGARAQFKIVVDNLKTTVTSSLEGSDTLYGIERLKFTDATFAFDLTSGQSGANAALVVGALMGKAALSNKALMGNAVAFFDQHGSLSAGCDVLVSAGVVAAIVGGSDSRLLAEALVRNILGSAPASIVDALAASVGSGPGQQTPAQLLAAAAGLEQTAIVVGLTGLAQTGLLIA